MPVDRLALHSNLRDYDVVFQPDDGFLSDLVERQHRLFVVDENVWAAHRGGALAPVPEDETFLLPIAEDLKNLASVEHVWDQLVRHAAKRNLTLISIGGGICQDITGFAASTLYRGIGWVFLPTTLLAQADSCIGSKTSLNYQQFKNLLGTFYPPNEVHIYTPFLATQNDLDYYSGVGEVVKLHIMGGRATAEHLAEMMGAIARRDEGVLCAMVQASLSIKQAYIEGDEFDMGRRNLLNYGHCFGHAIESATDFAVPHGQAVVIGMVLAQRVARARGLETYRDQIELVDRLFSAALLSEQVPASIDEDRVVEAMKRDKKRTGEGLVVVLMADGFEMTKVDDLAIDEAREALGDGLVVG